MVRQAVRETYTYINKDGSLHVVENRPLDGEGKVWVPGAYEPPVYPNPLDVRVGDAGLKVWMVIALLRAYRGNVDALLERYGQTLRKEDVAAAEWYYDLNKEVLDRKIEEEAREA